MTERELNPCPFCGGEAHLNGKDGNPCFIICGTCACTTYTLHPDAMPWTEAEAIAAWNRRADG